MFKFFNSKKGFTIVELMSVVVLLALGIVVLGNLFRLGFRAFDKSAERYEKQETAKLVAQYLQRGGAGLGGATKVELYDNIKVVPTTAEKGYNYLYVDPADGLLYIRQSGAAVSTAITSVPLYLSFEVIPYKDKDSNNVDFDNYNKSRAIKCNIQVLETGVTIATNNGKVTPPDSDDVYYALDVAYHFPNMVENDKLYVNKVLEKGEDGKGKYNNAKTVIDNVTYNAVDGTDMDGGGPDTVEAAIVVKYVTDLTVSGDQLMNDSNFKLYCFIASASYGVNNGEGVVGLLCDFRDNVLMTNPLGEAFVKAYYKLSPPIADIISESEPLKAAVRVALKPLIVVAVNALDEDVARQSAPWFAALILCGAGSTAMIIRMAKKRKKLKNN